MKVGVVFPYPLAPKGINAGAANATLEIVWALAEEGCEVVVYSPGSTCSEDTERDVKFVSYDGTRRNLIDMDALLFVLVDNRVSEMGLFRVSSGCRKAIFYHNAVFNAGDRRLMAFFRKWPDVFFVVSRYTERGARAAGIDNCVVIPNGVSLRKDSATLSSVKREPNLFLFVGALVAAKGIDRLVPAFDHFAKDRPGTRLRVVGSARLWFRDRPDYEQATSSHVEFVGELRGHQVLEEYMKASFVVLPSEMEASPLSIIDGMASGCIPIVSSSGGLGELVTDNVSGIVIPAVSVEDIGQALVRAWSLNSNDLSRMSEVAKESVATRTWGSSAKLLVSAIKEVKKRAPWFSRW